MYKLLNMADFYSNEDDKGKDALELEKSIDMVDYFFYLLLKQAIFEKISNYHLKNILQLINHVL